MDVIYTNADRSDVGVLRSFELDMSFGDDENDFEVTFPIDSAFRIESDAAVYVEGTEFGGIVDGMKVKTGEDQSIAYYGRTWHGILESKVLKPDHGEPYLTYSGEANAVIRSIVGRIGLLDLFDVSSDDSGIRLSGRFDRFAKAYSGLRKALASSGGKLRMSHEGEKVTLSAVPAAVYSDDDEIDSDHMDFDVDKCFRPVNHLVCLGTGELTDRIVVDLYSDDSGSIGETPFYTGLEDRQEVYEVSNAERDELVEKGIAKLKECLDCDSVEVSINDATTYDVGDTVSAYEVNSGVTASTTIVKKTLRINADHPEGDVEYEVGKVSYSTSFSGSSESGGSGGASYTFGHGLTKTGNRIDADVDDQDLASVEDLARTAIKDASDAGATAGKAKEIADKAVQSVDGVSPISVCADGTKRTLSHLKSGVEPGSFGAGSKASPGFGESVAALVRITVDEFGHVTGASTETLEIPSSIATESSDGLLCSGDKAKLDGIDEGANLYVLPIAASDVLGGIIPDGKTITVDPETGKASAQAGQSASFLAAHPVDSYFETEDSADPSNEYGGSWERVPSQGGFKWKRTG